MLGKITPLKKYRYFFPKRIQLNPTPLTRERPFNLKRGGRGLCFFWKKNSASDMARKNILKALYVWKNLNGWSLNVLVIWHCWQGRSGNFPYEFKQNSKIRSGCYTAAAEEHFCFMTHIQAKFILATSCRTCIFMFINKIVFCPYSRQVFIFVKIARRRMPSGEKN